MITIIIPANNEQSYIGTCLECMLQSAEPVRDHTAAGPVQVVVVANGCTDATVAEARALAPEFEKKDWQLDVLDLAEGGKIKALNAGDGAARHDRIAYIDADIRVSRDLIAQLAEALSRPEPVYASGRPVVPSATSMISRRYARFWEKLPFITRGVPGCGVFAVNASARARWEIFPDIISDDTFVRFHFSSAEMQGVAATYDWPITEGFASLVRVRRRQDEGLEEIRQLRPDLAARMEPTAPDCREKLGLFLQDPIGFVIYAAVAITVRLPLFRNHSSWERGR